MNTKNSMITLETAVHAPIEKVWEFWTHPEHITQWNVATDTWCCPSALNDLRPGGNFTWRMESKDGTMGFDFSGTYNQVDEKKYISFTLSDDRSVEIHFQSETDHVIIKESFEAEGTNLDEQQRAGWQAILDNFKSYTESNL